jgi:hypothetical protein
MTEDTPKYEYGEIEPTEEMRKHGELVMQVMSSGRRIPRCGPCNKNGGKTNTNVVSVATESTPDCKAGDFLCLFHDHRTSSPLPDWVKSAQN